MYGYGVSPRPMSSNTMRPACRPRAHRFTVVNDRLCATMSVAIPELTVQLERTGVDDQRARRRSRAVGRVDDAHSDATAGEP